MTDRARAERLDANDPLASFRDRFAIDDPETIYLDGNSLGRLPLATRGRLSIQQRRQRHHRQAGRESLQHKTSDAQYARA